MTITDQQLADLAAKAVEESVRKDVHDRMGQGEQLFDEFEEYDELSEAEQDALAERFEAALKRYLPVNVFDVEFGTFRPAQED